MGESDREATQRLISVSQQLQEARHKIAELLPLIDKVMELEALNHLTEETYKRHIDKFNGELNNLDTILLKKDEELVSKDEVIAQMS